MPVVPAQVTPSSIEKTTPATSVKTVPAAATKTPSKAVEREQARAKQPQAPRRRVTKRSNSRNLWLWGGLAALAIIAIIVGTVLYNNNQSNGGISGVVTYTGLSRDHVTTKVNYPQVPPVGGPHNPVWQNCGIYDSPIANENAVHSMEHGAVWITYQPSLSTTDVQTLQNMVRGHAYALLSPYPGLPSPVVASAWGVQLKVNSASDPRLAHFLSKYEQGPQTQEPGASCTGGTGTPVQ